MYKLLIILGYLFFFCYKASAQNLSVDPISEHRKTDTVTVDFVMYADPLSGQVFNKKNQRMILTTIVRTKRNEHSLSDFLSKELLLFDLSGKPIDWIVFHVNSTTYSILNQGSASKIFFKNEAFHKEP